MKMYRVLRNLALFICAAVACSSLLAVSCEDPGNDPVPETKYTLSVSPSGSVSFSAEGSSMNFKVTTNADSDRCLFPSNDWLSVEFDSAANAYAVTVAPNTTGNERSFELKFCGYKSGSDKEVVSAVVKAVQPSVKKEDLSVSADPAALEFLPEGGKVSTTVKVGTKVFKRVRAVRSQEMSGWLTMNWENASDDASLLLVLEASPNDSGTERGGIVSIYAGMTDDDTANARDGNMDPTRAAAVTVTVKQPAKSSSAPEGAGSGLFTINGKGGQVRFSLGNLQYQASTKTWRFAEHQWDYVGGTTLKNVTWGNVSGSSNNKVSSTYAGWIDLFCWGTSGWNSGAKIYSPDVPASTTISNSFYPGNSASNNLTGDYAKADWGVYNAISNGGNKAGLWRTLTADEWDYIVQKREGSRYAHAKVNGVNGVILLPDGWKESTYSLKNINKGLHWNSSVSVVSATDWEGKLEPAGCVFLPNAGQRSSDWDYEKSRVAKTYFSDWDAGDNGLEIGMYWSTTAPEDYGYDQACYLGLGWQGPGVTASDWCRAEGYSVRLVQDK